MRSNNIYDTIAIVPCFTAFGFDLLMRFLSKLNLFSSKKAGLILLV